MTADEIRKEAHMAWQMCADIHHCYAKGKDPYYDIRQPIFQQRADEMRMAAADETAEHLLRALAEAISGSYISSWQ